MTVRRQGTDKPIEVKLMRENIKINNVPFHGMATEDIGYIVLSGFTQDAGNEVREALQELKGKTPGLKGVILDVRGNPGGLLNEAVNVSSVFIPNGEKVVETKGRMEGSQKDYLTRLAPVDLEIPLAVVTDRRSASASEIVTGVVQDLDRGIVVGERTYGKGLVQTTRPLSYNNQIKLTTAKYYIPSGRCIQAINYAERDDEGAVKRIPDSLRNEFHTRSGRLVYDGGGIEPDIQVAPEKLKAVTVELERKGLIFDYATGFALRNAEIPAPSEFEVSDAIYTEFMDFVKTHDFTYDTKAEKELEKLKEIVEEESEFASISAPYTALSSKLKEQKKDALIAHKDEISRLLKEEIILRYYYEVGVIEASFTDDPAIKEAISVLHDPTRYNKILGR
jgi:carboxyl-terminal processing protease